MKFVGQFENLKSVVKLTGIAGEWRRLGENHHQYHANTGAVLNWWKSTGTITFQGYEAAAVSDLKAAFLKYLLDIWRRRDHSKHSFRPRRN